MKKFALALGLLLGLSSTALAQSNSTVALTAGSGVNIFARAYASTNKIFGHTLCDPTTEGQCAAVDSSGQLKIIQGTASALNATVVGTGTFATQAAQSGTWNITNISGTITLPTGAATSAKQPALGTAGSASADVITVQGIASGTGLAITNAALGLAQGASTSGQTGVLPLGAVTTAAPTYTTTQSSPLSLTTAGGLRTDLATITGVAPKLNSGNGSAGSLNVYIATDQPALTNAQPGNFTQIGGNTVLTGNGVTGNGAQRVSITSDNTAIAGWGHVAVAAAPPSGATYMGVLGSGATGGHVAAPIMCDNHTFKHITSATDTVAVQGVASQTIYICAWRSRAAGVATWYLENTASTNANCSSTLTQITGVATEAANTGETWGGAFWSGLKNTSGNGLCINSTGTGGVDVDIWYAQF